MAATTTRKALLDAYDTFLFDGDGCLYLGNTPVDGAVEAVAALMTAGKQVVLVTNNSTATAASFEEVGDDWELDVER